MKTIIDTLFNEIEMESVMTDFGLLYYFKLENTFSYWMIVEIEDLNLVIVNQSNYFTKAKEKLNNEWFDKNANLLILYKQPSFEEIDKDKIIDIEENPYLFKKQVLIYKESEKEKLVEAINESELTFKAFFEIKILSDEIFGKHKSNINNNDFESLLYRLAHKIPFINIKVNQENGLLALTSINDAKVDLSPYKLINDTLTETFFDKTTSDVADLTPDEIYEQLLIVLSQNEN
jgi:hypothetical protein